MAWDDNTRFRITTWPQAPVPLPPPTSLAGEVFESSLVEWLVDVPDPGGYAKMEFGEVYLELYSLDLDDPQAILSFVERYSSLGIRSLSWGHESYGHYMGFPGVDTFADALADMVDQHATGDLDIETEGEFRFGVGCLRDMTTAWRVMSDQLDQGDAQWVTPCWGNSADPVPTPRVSPDAPEFFKRLEHDRDAVPELVLQLGMRSGLAPFFPRLSFLDPDSGEYVDPDHAIYHARTGLGFTGPTTSAVFGYEIPLYSICCLELFNHMAESVPYRTCQNETCGRLFVRQSGRAKAGQYRTSGVKYCSASCANAQAQRAYRRRQADSAGD